MPRRRGSDNRNARRVKAQAMILAAKVAEDRYVRRMRAAMRMLHRILMGAMEVHLPHIAKGEVRQDAGHSKWKKQIDRVYDAIAQMREPVGEAFDLMAKTVRQKNFLAAKDLLGITPTDTGVADKIKEFRDANIELMEKAGRDYVDDVREVLEEEDTFGLTVEALKARLLERASVSESRAELIARDQTLKLNANLNELRQTNAGITQYVWSTSHDERVRPSHADMDGRTCSWANPPDVNGDGEPLNPGEDFQCRCVALPVLPEEELEEED